MIFMPGKSYQGVLPPLTPKEKILQQELQKYIDKISGEIGEHNYFKYENLLLVEDFITDTWTDFGYEVKKQEYEVDKQKFRNLEVEILGSKQPDEITIIGAHYDTVFGSPGANDNTSGVAAILSLGRLFINNKPEKTLRFVAFVNEEPPFFWTENMGSVVYAKRCRQENITAMLSLETIGYYSDKPGSQKYPLGLLNTIYPITGNFISFVGNFSSAKLIRQAIKSFRQNAKFPSEGAILPNQVNGAGWSDHWSFWQENYPGIMVTDTAPFRYPYYHTSEDTPDKINYDHLARVVAGLEMVIKDLTIKKNE
jgi:Zn-dependent M28 family amino/carboxypeptidase